MPIRHLRALHILGTEGRHFSFQRCEERIKVCKSNEKYCFLAEYGNLSVRAFYDDAKDYSNGLAAVKSGSNWGYIDPNNLMVIDFQYQDAYSFTDEGTADVYKNGEWQIIDKEGTLVYFKPIGEHVQTETSTD